MKKNAKELEVIAAKIEELEVSIHFPAIIEMSDG